MSIKSTGLDVYGLKSTFFERLESIETFYQDLTTRVESKTGKEDYRWLGSLPAMREFGTGRLAKGLRDESYEVENFRYELTLEADRTEIDDDQTGQILARVNAMATRAAVHKDSLIADRLLDGATAGFNAYDGQTFFNDTRTQGDSGTIDNDLTGAIADKDDPTTAEFKQALKVAISRMMSFNDDTGQPSSIMPGGFVAVVPHSMIFAALETVNASLISSTSNVLEGAARVIHFPWLSATDKWYLLKTNEHVRPLIFQDRQPIEFGALEGETDAGFIREKYLYGVRARYRIAYGEPRYAVRYAFTTT